MVLDHPINDQLTRTGGGIIDMMNRRLRERLTEGEILQIFVDVCEGLAAMHNLQPALLHRDLKVNWPARVFWQKKDILPGREHSSSK